MLTADEIRNALRVCFDPELPVNIVDLGLVHEIHLAPDPNAPGTETRFHVRITLLRRTADEVREAMLLGQVGNRLAGMYAIGSSQVEVTDHPAWTAERISADGRASLGLNRAPSQGLVQIKI